MGSKGQLSYQWVVMSQFVVGSASHCLPSHVAFSESCRLHAVFKRIKNEYQGNKITFIRFIRFVGIIVRKFIKIKPKLTHGLTVLGILDNTHLQNEERSINIILKMSIVQDTRNCQPMSYLWMLSIMQVSSNNKFMKQFWSSGLNCF